MNRIVFIIPYYGKKPEYHNLWKLSALKNPNFDFLFITDIKSIVAQNNIFVEYLEWDDLVGLVQSVFEFKISLESPYKLCDYKPAYGLIFEKYIMGYEFWGNCDVDLILGDLNHFITDSVLDSNDKIYEHGHMTIYRNTFKINTHFMSDGPYPEFNYKEVFQSPDIFFFDEYFGMMQKSRRLKIATYNKFDFCDLDTHQLPFIDIHNKQQYIFNWNDGKLYSVNAITKKIDREVLYVHLQKRKMIDLVCSNEKNFWIYPNIFCTEERKLPGTFRKAIYTYKKKIKNIIGFFKKYRAVKSRYPSLNAYYLSRKDFKVRLALFFKQSKNE